MEQCVPCLAGELPSLWAEPTPPETATFDYLTGTEFKMQIEAIVEGFTSLRAGITKERAQMEKLWKECEKQIDRVLLNSNGFYGSVKGIVGSAVPAIPLLDLAETA